MYPLARAMAAANRRRATTTLIVMLMLAIGTNAIVQQNKQQPSQQQRSDDASAFNNHQQSGSIPAGNSASPPQQQQQQQVASASSQNQPQASYGAPVGSISAALPSVNYANSNSNNNQKPMSTYIDSMAAAASNPEQSYQAAAQSVNMALANSGILNNAYSGQLAGGQQQSGSGASGSPSTLSPLHYFYYPAAKESIQGPSKQADAMANSASNQYQSYTNYNDQYQPSYNNNPSPDVAASSHETSYMPQQMDGQVQPQQQAQQQQQQQHNFAAGDLASYASNQMQQQQQPQSQQQQQQQAGAQQSSTISFGGPASQSANQNQPGSNINDYLNPHMGGGHLQQQQQQQQQGAASGGPPSYQQNAQSMFNQLASGNDLSTSNFGNNGGMSSIASYMAPSGMPNNNQNNDLFGNGLFGSQFNSAASQLAPSSVTPPASAGQQQQPAGASSLYANALYGSQQQPIQQQQQQQQQQPSTGSLFGDASSLNTNGYPFLTAQQYSQLTGQPLGSLASEHSPLSIASAISAQQQQQQQQLQTPLTSSSTAPSSSKRFGLGSFIMPVLALAGLSLLIPTMSNLGTAAVGRRKRSIVEEKASRANRQQQIAYEPLLNGPSQMLKEGSLSEYMDRIERYYGIYKNAVESDECRNRLICEFGDAIKDIGGKGPVMSIIEHLVPNWMANKMHLFKEAAMNNREGREKCKMYACKNVDGSRQN